MKRIVLAIAAAALSALFVTPAFAEEPVPEGAGQAEDLIVHMETLAGIVTKAGGDCDALAVSLNGFVDTNAADIARLTDSMDALPESVQAELKVRFEARTQAAGQTMIEGLVACSTHDGVMQAFERLERRDASAAGGAASKVAVEVEPPDDADIEKLVGHIEQLAEVMASSQSDCPAMAKAIDAFSAAHKAEIETLTERMEALTPAQQEAIEKAYEPRMEAAFTRLMEGVMACGDDPAVGEAMQNLGM